MSTEEDLSPEVEYWLSPHTKHDCYFNVGMEPGPKERIGTFRAFLIGYSEPFRAMLQDSELAEQGDISIVDVSPDTFRDFLKCLYTGLCNTIIGNLSFKKSCDLLYVADKYLVKKLKDKLIKQCLDSLLSEVSVINAACSSKVFMQETRLKTALEGIVQCQIKNIISSTNFFQITEESLLWILTLDPLDTNEISLWVAVLKWGENKTNSNEGKVVRECIIALLKFIRFCTMPIKDFCGKVVSSKVLTGEEVYQICKYHIEKEMPNMKFICNVVKRRYHTGNLIYKSEEFTKVLIYSDTHFTFSYTFSNICSLKDEAYSRKFEFQDCEWYLKVKQCGLFLGLCLELEQSNFDPEMEICVDATFTLVNHAQRDISSTFQNVTFDVTNFTLEIQDFILWSKLLSPSELFLHNDSITVSVKLQVQDS